MPTGKARLETASKQPVDADCGWELDAVVSQLVVMAWVKGHSGASANEIDDELANLGAFRTFWQAEVRKICVKWYWDTERLGIDPRTGQPNHRIGCGRNCSTGGCRKRALSCLLSIRTRSGRGCVAVCTVSAMNVLCG